MQYVQEKILTVDGSVKTKRYKLIESLGAGSFSRCWKVNPVGTDKIYAMKIVSKKNMQCLEQEKVKESSQTQLLSQIKIHQSLSHPHIVFLQHSFEDEEHQYILLQNCSKGTLDQRFPKYAQNNEQDIRYYGLQILSALKYLHKKKILHRDLKLSNCFITSDDKIKIGDFGFACKLQSDEELKRQTCGTPNFLSPEVAGGFGHSFPSDIWSFGVILYRMKFGICPFETQTLQQTIRRIKTLEYSFTKWISISPELKDLIQKILQVDYDSRPTIEDIQKHPFFGGSIDDDENKLIKKHVSPIKVFIQRFLSRQKCQTKNYVHKVDSCKNLKQMKTILREKTQEKIDSSANNVLKEESRLTSVNNISKMTTMNSIKGITPRGDQISRAYFGKLAESKHCKAIPKTRSVQPLITQYFPYFLISNIQTCDQCTIIYLTNGLRQIFKDRQTYIVFINGYCVDRQGVLIKDLPRLVDYFCRQKLKEPNIKLTQQAFKQQVNKKNYVMKWKNISGQMLFELCGATFITTELKGTYLIKSEHCQCLYNNKLQIVKNQSVLSKYKKLVLEKYSSQNATPRQKKFLE